MIFTIIGILGLIGGSYAIWVRNEKNQDWFFIVAGVLLLIYSLSIGNIIFTVLQIVFIGSATIELIKLKNKK